MLRAHRDNRVRLARPIILVQRALMAQLVLQVVVALQEIKGSLEMLDHKELEEYQESPQIPVQQVLLEIREYQEPQ